MAGFLAANESGIVAFLSMTLLHLGQLVLLLIR
jgi:hypothetical protein